MPVWKWVGKLYGITIFSFSNLSQILDVAFLLPVSHYVYHAHQRDTPEKAAQPV